MIEKIIADHIKVQRSISPAVAVWTADHLNAFLTYTADQPLHLMWRQLWWTRPRVAKLMGHRHARGVLSKLRS